MMQSCMLLPRAAILFLCFVTNSLVAASQWQDYAVEVADQELVVKRFVAEGEHLIVWVTPGSGTHEREYALAQALVQRNVEVWHIDLAESLFLPGSISTLRAMDGRYVAGLVSAAHAQTGKQIVLMTRGYGSLPVLRGARLWQQEFFARGSVTKPAYLSGAILFSPELYSQTAGLGLEPIYDPIASATNIPIMLYQGGKRGNRWQLEKSMALLESGGAQIYLKLMPEVTGLFYDEDISSATLYALEALPGELKMVLKTLRKMSVPSQVIALNKHAAPARSSLDTKLVAFRGEPVPLPLKLNNSQGKIFERKDYRGKITLVNFWASWCKPCVEEIPSLNSLREKMQARPFELISVNYAEDPLRVAEFLQKVKVSFPVLLDHDGRVSAQWNVLVFPATFVIGPDGKIIYGVNGAIYWDSPDVIKTLENLL